MPVGYMDKYITKMEQIAKGLEAAQKEAGPKLEAAIERWTTATEQDARAILNRPKWLLQQNITDKIIDYKKTRKIWAMVGFRFQSKSARDPGYYGQYHEAGWAPDRKVVKVPDHFLRKAKEKNRERLLAEIAIALKGMTDAFLESVRKGA